MIAIVKHAYHWVVDAVRFSAAVWHDARALQAEAQAKHGYSGF